MVTMTEHHPKTQGDDAGVPDLTEHLDRSWYRVGVGANRVEDVLGLTAMRGGAGALYFHDIAIYASVLCSGMSQIATTLFCRLHSGL
jgi:hypothetical protein